MGDANGFSTIERHQIKSLNRKPQKPATVVPSHTSLAFRFNIRESKQELWVWDSDVLKEEIVEWIIKRPTNHDTTA